MAFASVSDKTSQNETVLAYHSPKFSLLEAVKSREMLAEPQMELQEPPIFWT